MQRLILATASLLLLAAAPAEQPGADSAGKILPSLVKIVSVCGGGDSRIATGFVWGPGHSVVTDLHVVVGCPPPYTVLYFTRDGGTLHQVAREATIAHVLRAADLVMLSVKDPPDAPPLQLASQPVAPEQWVEAWGFPLGVEAPINTRLQVTFANDLFPALSSTLDDAARAQLTTLHFPDLNTQVLHLSGPLQPGDSGAPVVDADGALVGVGSGGLQQGASSISWAMRAHYLANLPTSTDTIPAAGDANSLFAYATHTTQSPPALPKTADSTSASLPAGPPTVTCGALALTNRGVRTLSQLAVTDDTRAAIASIALAHGVTVTQISAAPFRIWIEPHSGAAIVVPAEASLAPDGDFCRADPAEAGAHLLVRLGTLPADPATPEWELAVSIAEWHVLGDLSRAEKSKLRPGNRVAGWSGRNVVDRALVRRAVLEGKAGLVIYRSDLYGSGVSVTADAVVPPATTQQSADAGLALARMLAGMVVSGFPPLDRTQPADIQVPPDEDSLGDTTSVTLGPKLYPILSCGTPFMLMTPVPSFAALAAATPHASQIASTIATLAQVDPDAIRTARYDVWAQTWTGTTVLLPRDVQSVGTEPGSKDCLFTVDQLPWLHLLLLGRKAAKLQQAEDLARDALARRLQLTMTDWHALSRGKEAEDRLARWEARGTDGNGRPVRVLVVAQAQRGYLTVTAAVAPAGMGAGGPAPRLGAALAGLLLAPLPTMDTGASEPAR